MTRSDPVSETLHLGGEIEGEVGAGAVEFGWEDLCFWDFDPKA